MATQSSIIIDPASEPTLTAGTARKPSPPDGPPGSWVGSNALFFSGNPMNGTIGDDFMFGLVSGPDHTINADFGDDLVMGDYDGFNSASGSTSNNQFGTAIDLDAPVNWSTNENPHYADDSIPHREVYVELTAGQTEYYSLTIGAGQTITVDIDYGGGLIGGATDTTVFLYRSSGILVASSGDSLTTDGGFGSTSQADSFLTFTAGAADTYFIQVVENDTNFDGDETFLMNISVTGHAVGANIVSGKDTIDGGSAVDELFGLGGDDSIIGGVGADLLHGGSGNDVLDGGILNDTLFGDVGDDTIFGSRFEISFIGDSIDGGDGDDSLIGGSGNDTISGGFLFDTITGGDGDDLIDGGADADTVEGGLGDDSLTGGNGDDVLDGGFGSDILSGGLGNDTILAGLGGFIGFGDSIDGGEGDDLLICGLGNDTISDGDGEDTIDAGDGDDLVIGGFGLDVSDGGSGIDTMEVSAFGAAYIWNMSTGVTNFAGETAINFENALTGGGNDSITGTSGANLIVTTNGNDTVIGRGGDDTLDGGIGEDSLLGGIGFDRLIGGDGNDTLAGGGDGDVLDGGDGLDWADYSGSAAKVVADLKIPENNTNDAFRDSYVSIENLRGTAGKDKLYGDDAANRIEGLGENDTLVGRGGDDTLAGGLGKDRLKGGDGLDRFELASLDTFDKILDFTGGDDLTILDRGVFGLTPGALDPNAFVVASSAQDADDRIIYRAGTGQLFFDPDGNGAQAQVLIARFSGAPTLDAADFIVI